jgi:hypothetical protein
MDEQSVDVSEQERLAFHTRQRELLRQNSRGTAARRVTPKIGSQYGELTVRDCLGKGPRGHLWLLTCSCGSEAVRDTGALNWAVREGMAPQCPRCLAERRGGLAHVRMMERQERIRERWEEHGTLWTGADCVRLMDEVRADLEAEFGALEWKPRVQDLYYDETRMWVPPKTCPGAWTEEREARAQEAIRKEAKKWKRLIQGKATKPLLDFVNREDLKRRRRAIALKGAATKRLKKAEREKIEREAALFQKETETWVPLKDCISAMLGSAPGSPMSSVWRLISHEASSRGFTMPSKRAFITCLHEHFHSRAVDEEIVWDLRVP